MFSTTLVDHFEKTPLDKTVSIIKDPIYGPIRLETKEQRLILTPEFQRLKRIKQLGFLALVWPSATHTRFAHSLGVYYLARRLTQNLAARSQETPQQFSQIDRDTFLAAALLHDVGHYPYPQALEGVGFPARHHEEIGADIILDSQITEILKIEWGVEPQRVARLISKPNEEIIGIDRYFAQLLSGPIDLDKLDYLNRDTYHCGICSVAKSVEDVIQYLSLQICKSETECVITQRSLDATIYLLEIRQLMTHKVYHHVINRAATTMLSRAVQDALSTGCIQADDLKEKDDETILNLLKDRAGTESSTWKLVDRILDGRLYVPVLEACNNNQWDQFMSSARQPRKRRYLERTLSKILNQYIYPSVADHEILLDITASKQGMPPSIPSTTIRIFAAKEISTQENFSYLLKLALSDLENAVLPQAEESNVLTSPDEKWIPTYNGRSC